MFGKKFEQEKIDKIVEYFFLILLFVQFAFLCYYNLIDVRYSMDHDMANGFYHYMQVIKNGTLNIPNWHHTTSLELDTTFLFAVPIYYLVHDLFLASGISSILYVVLYMVTIYGCMHCAKVNRTIIYLTMTLVLTPYTFGMLDYMNMLFFGVSWYTVKTLTPLLLIWLVQLLGMWNELSKKKRIGTGIVACIYFVMLFVTSLSTGIYTMMCGIAPIILCILVDIWFDGGLQKKYNRWHVLLLAVSFMVFFVGYKLYGSFYGETSAADTMQLTKLENFAVNLRACVAGIFQLFGAIATEDIGIMSLDGIVYCLRFVLVVLFLTAFVYTMVAFVRKKEKIDCKKYLAFLFLVDLVVLVLGDSRYSSNVTMEYRYFLIGAVPLIVLLGIQLFQYQQTWNTFQRNAGYLVLFCIACVLVIGNNKNVLKHWDRSSYAVELCDYFNQLDIDSVFFIDDPKTANICRAIDSNHEYGAFISSNQKLELSYCSYEESQYGSFYGAKNAIAIVTGTAMTDYLPEQIASNYTMVGTAKWYDIYVSDMVYFP